MVIVKSVSRIRAQRDESAADAQSKQIKIEELEKEKIKNETINMKIPSVFSRQKFSQNQTKSIDEIF